MSHHTGNWEPSLITENHGGNPIVMVDRNFSLLRMNRMAMELFSGSSSTHSSESPTLSSWLSRNSHRFSPTELSSFQMNAQIQTNKGNCDFSIFIEPMFDEKREIVELILTFVDRNLVPASTHAMQRDNRWMKILRSINQQVLQAENNQDLYPAMCRILVEQGKFDCAWVSIVDTHEEDDTHLKTMHGMVPAEFLSLYATLPTIDPQQFLLSNLNEIQPVRTRFSQKNKYQDATMISIPIILKVRMIAILHIVSTHPSSYHPSEMIFLSQLSHDLSLGIEKIHEAKKFIQTIISNAGVGIIVYDCQLRFKLWNEFMEKYIGYAAKDVLGKYAFDVLPYLKENGVDQLLYRALAGETIRSRDMLFVVPETEKNGWYVGTYTPLRDSNDAVIGVVASIKDMTMHKMAELAIRQAEQEKTAILNSMKESVVYLDTDLKIIWANREALERSKLKQNELIGNFCHQIWGNTSTPCEYCLSKKSIETGQPQMGEKINEKGKAFSVQSYPVKNQHGIIVGVVEKSQDITEQKRMKEQAEIQKQQLIMADKMAALGILVSGVAHEINNPNSFIMLNTPLLRSFWSDIIPVVDIHYKQNGDFMTAGMPYSEMRHYISDLLAGIADGSERIKRIVSDLKDFARQDLSGTNQLVDINKIVSGASNLVGNQIKQSTKYFDIQYGNNLPKLKGNFQRLEQVIINLLQNACHALLDESKGIQISTSISKDKKWIIVQVEDEGIGIQEKDLPHILDPFFTTKRDRGGTGLGLSVSAGIVQDHGGRLDFTSQPGKGTVAILFLPV